MKKILSFSCVFILILSGYFMTISTLANSKDDLDPLVDISITVDIHAIRALDRIEWGSDPDFFVVVVINDEKFTSPTWDDTRYLYDIWSITKDVNDAVENVDITIELWDDNAFLDTKCDISKTPNKDNEGYFVDIVYNIKTGHWYGDDYCIGDGSGYGRVCGSSDGSIYKDENDCELWFSIYQNDYDNDSLPYWIETNVYYTDPQISNIGEDSDFDGVPIEWEHKWGFNPLVWEDHENYDPDGDSLTNIEEFLTRDFDSDPFRRDVFMEIDFMDTGPNGEYNIVENDAFELLKNPFHRRNIVYHVDNGQVYGGELIPFDNDTTSDEVIQIYNEYFIKNESENWRRGVFHYGIIVHKVRLGGWAFRGDLDPIMGYGPGTNSFVIATLVTDLIFDNFYGLKSRDYISASNIMHEMGHNFGFRWGNPFGCDGQLSKRPRSIGYWIFGRYKSIMNYRYTYTILDYSDGSHGIIDNNDWEKMDLSYFEIP